MAENSATPPLIVIKRKKAGGHGHHGGAWKVAYADFVTAMMAFFLLLWLLNVTTEEQKNGIADYFTPSQASDAAVSGAGQILGGATITIDGSSVSPSSPISISDPVATTGTNMESTENDEEGNPVDTENQGQDNNQDTSPENPNTSTHTQDHTSDGQNTQASPSTIPTEDAINKAIAEREQKAFDQVAQELRQAIQNVPELALLQKSLIIDQTPEGLRIQLVDQEGYSMFPRGSAVMADRTRQLIDLVAKAVTALPNNLSISGHTDSTKYQNSNGYSNWELSSDRANAARRELAKDGVNIDRIATVVGRADREPFIKDNPEDPRNRRLSIILIRQVPMNPALASPASDAPPPEPTEPPQPATP